MLSVLAEEQMELELNEKSWTAYTSDDRVVFASRPLQPEVAMRMLSVNPGSLEEDLRTNEQIDDVALLVRTAEGVLFRSDLTNSRPIFYDKDLTWVSDECPTGGLGVDDKAASEFLHFGYVTGDNTLFDGVRRSQASELLSLRPRNLARMDLTGYRYTPAVVQKDALDHAFEIDRFLSALNSSIQSSLSNIQKGGRLVVPLSGGHDSRLLLNQLHHLGYRDVICFSYGEHGNLQSQISKEVASAFGYPWHFVEYTDEKWARLVAQGLVRQYLLFAHRGVSTPHLLDFLAISELIESGTIIQSDTVIPGHTLDFLAGGHFRDSDLSCQDLSGAVDHILLRHSYSSDQNNPFLSTIQRGLKNRLSSVAAEPEYLQEWFNWRERQTKFILNSCQTYAFFGLKFATPFWQSEMVRYWLSIPPKAKKCRKFYLEIEPTILDDRLKNIPFANDAAASADKSRLRKILLSIIPASVVSSFISVTGRRTLLDEGMNRIFAKSADRIKDLVPILSSHKLGKDSLVRDAVSRRPYQLNPSRLTTLVTLDLLLENRD